MHLQKKIQKKQAISKKKCHFNFSDSKWRTLHLQGEKLVADEWENGTIQKRKNQNSVILWKWFNFGQNEERMGEKGLTPHSAATPLAWSAESVQDVPKVSSTSVWGTIRGQSEPFYWTWGSGLPWGANLSRKISCRGTAPKMHDLITAPRVS